MCTIGVSNRIKKEDKDFWKEIHGSEIAKKHKGELTKARQYIQATPKSKILTKHQSQEIGEEQGEVECYA